MSTGGMMRMEKKRKYILGCDIGNGYGYVSLLEDPKADPMPLFPNQYNLTNIGMPTTAYAVPPEGTDIEVFHDGKPAESLYGRKPELLIRAVKTRLHEGMISLPGLKNPVAVSDVYSAVARDLLLLAQEELQNKSIDPVYDIVFTFPAVFSENVTLLETMQQSIEKLEIQGNKIHVLGRLPEPAAVALDYLHYMQHVAPEDIRISKDNYTVLVYDLGHGTFDTAVVTAQSKGTPYKMHLNAGLPDVGGKDFDMLLYNEICAKLQEEYGYTPKNERQREGIRKEAVKVKLALSKEQMAVASVVYQEEYCNVEISRERFEELSEHLMVQTLEKVQEMMDEAGQKGIKIDAIVLSGGGSNMPMVSKNLELLAEGELPVRRYRLSEAVSYGASRFAYGISQEIADASEEKGEGGKQDPGEIKKPEKLPEPNKILEQRTDCAYGIWVDEEGSMEGRVRLLIAPGEKRPATSEPVTFFAQSSHIAVRLYRLKEKDRELDFASVRDCESVMRIPFDVEAGSRYQLRMTALENYGIQVELQSDRGSYFCKSTFDAIAKLV